MSASEAVNRLTGRVNELCSHSIVLYALIFYDFLLFEVLLASEFCVKYFDLFDLLPLLVKHYIVPIILVQDFVWIEEVLAILG